MFLKNQLKLYWQSRYFQNQMNIVHTIRLIGKTRNYLNNGRLKNGFRFSIIKSQFIILLYYIILYYTIGE